MLQEVETFSYWMVASSILTHLTLWVEKHYIKAVHVPFTMTVFVLKNMNAMKVNIICICKTYACQKQW